MKEDEPSEQSDKQLEQFRLNPDDNIDKSPWLMFDPAISIEVCHIEATHTFLLTHILI